MGWQWLAPPGCGGEKGGRGCVGEGVQHAGRLAGNQGGRRAADLEQVYGRAHPCYRASLVVEMVVVVGGVSGSRRWLKEKDEEERRQAAD